MNAQCFRYGALALLASLCLVPGCSDQNPAEVAGGSRAGSKIVLAPPGTNVLADAWVVVLNDDVPDVRGVIAELQEEIDMSVTHVYEHALNGFSATVGKNALERLAADPRVMMIEPVQEMHVDAQTIDWGIRAIAADSSSALCGDGAGTVTGVQIYILDTGCDLDHPDLNLDTLLMRNYTNDASVEDGHGHGTHCAGIAAARDNTIFNVGVAPGAPVIPIKVLGNNGSGYNSWVIAGVDYVAQRKRNNGSIPMVASMSLGGGPDGALDRAITSAINDGVVVVVAAGNDNRDASLSSPSRCAAAITVGAYGSSGSRASFSNYGRLVDIFAPGVSIYSTYKNGTGATLSGTSMACPYVAGVAALYISNPSNASKTPLEVRNQLVFDSRYIISVGRAKTTRRSVHARTY